MSTRFAPLSYEKPKGLLNVKGEVLIERQIKQLHSVGIKDITLVVGYMKEKMFYLEEKYGVEIVVNEDYYKYNNTSSMILVEDRLFNTYICSSDNYFVKNPFESRYYKFVNTNINTKELVEAMCENAERPVIFPLSNPTKLAEATAKDLIEWSNGKAFVATGISSDDIEYNGINYVIGQANNALIYPGLGLGMLASEASLLTDEMIGAAAHALSGIVDITKPGAPVLPPFKYVAEVSLKVATAVAKKAQEQGLARAAEQDMEKAVRDFRWTPKY